jgi:transcription antitermination factor NusG
VRFGAIIPAVPDSFVESLRQDVRNRSEDDEELFSVSPVIEIGDEVEIAHGPLQGMRGTIVSVAPAAERVKILLEFLGQPQAVNVDLFSILQPRRPIP